MEKDGAQISRIEGPNKLANDELLMVLKENDKLTIDKKFKVDCTTIERSIRSLNCVRLSKVSGELSLRITENYPKYCLWHLNKQKLEDFLSYWMLLDYSHIIITAQSSSNCRNISCTARAYRCSVVGESVVPNSINVPGFIFYTHSEKD